MQIRVKFDRGLVALVIGPGVIFMETDTFKVFDEGLNQVRKDVADWELRHGDGELDSESALTEFERMLADGG